MSSFWQERNLVHCAGPPGVPPGAAGGDGFVPNCWAGMASRLSLDPTKYPLITPGAADFSIEFWHRALDIAGGDVGDDTVNLGFFYNPANVANASYAFNYYQFSGEVGGVDDRAQFRTVAPLALLTREIAAPSIARWNHFVVNYDRAGDMMIWRNAVMIANGAINNEILPE